MRLNKGHKEEFIEQIIYSLPSINKFDFDEHYKKLIQEAAESVLDEDIRAFAKKYPSLIERKRHYYLNNDIPDGVGRYIYCIYMHDHRINNLQTEKIEEKIKELKPILDAHLKQVEERKNLINRLSQIVHACSTDKQLKEIFPEFAHFLPVDDNNPKYLPVSAANNIVADLVKAGLKIEKPQETA